MTTSHQLPHAHAHAHAQAHAHTHTHAQVQAHSHSSTHSHSHSHSHAHSHTHHAHSNDHNKHRLSHDSNVALDTGLATAISSSIIENCDSPDDTSSIEGSTQSAVDTPVDGEDLQCVLKDLDEYEFAVGVAEDRNKRCRRTMEVRRGYGPTNRKKCFLGRSFCAPHMLHMMAFFLSVPLSFLIFFLSFFFSPRVVSLSLCLLGHPRVYL